ncbi:NusA N-terminal domain-containing protein [Escherichia coli]
MNKEILAVVEAVSNEKGATSREDFRSIGKRAGDSNKEKNMNKRSTSAYRSIAKSGDFDTFRRWLVVDEVTQPTKEITL